MVDWICESPFPLAVFGTVLSILCYVVARQRGDNRMLAFAFFAAALIPSGWLIDLAVETDAEQVEQELMGLITAYRDGNTVDIQSRVSKTNPLLSAAATVASAVFRFNSERVTDIRIKSVDSSSGRAESTAHFRLNADFYGESFGEIGRKPTRWETRWIQEDDRWKLTTVSRLDPITGEVLTSQEQLLRQFGGSALNAGKQLLERLGP